MAINENGVQVERQYIGARYVPKFFSGVVGSPEWISGLQYEALTIVTYLGNSFTSKVPVPAGVGNPADNPEYWANTGNFNAQVEGIKQQIINMNQELNDINQNLSTQLNNVNNRVDKISKGIKIDSNSRFIFITDSYGTYPTASDNWVLKTVQALNTTNYEFIHRGSTGFTTVSVDTWENMLINSNIENPETVTHIVVGGGSNDTVTSDYATILAAGKSFVNYARGRFPNAIIYILPFGYGWTAAGHKRADMVKAYCDLRSERVVVSQNIAYVLQNKNLLIDGSVHPNSTGVSRIVEKVLEVLYTGSCDVVYRTILTPFNVNGEIVAEINEELVNDSYTITFINFNIKTPISLNWGNQTITNLPVAWPCIHSLGNNGASCGANGFGLIKSGDAEIYTPVIIWGSENKTYITLNRGDIVSTSGNASLYSGNLKGSCPSLYA